MAVTKREYEERARRLHTAVDQATKRVGGGSGEPSLHVRVITGLDMVTVTGRHHEGVGVSTKMELLVEAEIFKSYRVGRNPGDNYFELKLIPNLRPLVVPCEHRGTVTRDTMRLSDVMGIASGEPEVFIRTTPEDLVRVYSGNQLRSIIARINSIR